VVTSDGISSSATVQVATVTPVVTSSTANLAANATTLTINGVGFDPAAANDAVTLNDGAVGKVTAATATALTVTLSTEPTSSGSLTAVVASNGQSSGTAVPVATVTPVVTPGTARLAANAPQIIIKGLDFDPTAANNTVSFDDGAVGSVTTATATSLSVTLTTAPTTTGSLTAIVKTDGVSSGAAVQVATVVAAISAPTVTSSTTTLAANATTLTINGSGFDVTGGINDLVTFNDGAAGSVTAATATTLTVAFTTLPTTAGSLTAVVTTDGITSATAVQVATVGGRTFLVNVVGDTSGSARGTASSDGNLLHGDLRYCLNQALANQLIETISFAPSVFTTAAQKTITLNSSLVTEPSGFTNVYGPTAFIVGAGNNITINGSLGTGIAGISIDGGGATRLFVVEGGGTLGLQNLTLSGGSATGFAGGTSRNGGAGGGSAGLGAPCSSIAARSLPTAAPSPTTRPPAAPGGVRVQARRQPAAGAAAAVSGERAP
jgi:hypothetical protein